MKKIFSLVICVMTLLFAGCELNPPATSSKVETGVVSDITTESVVLHGVVNVDISQYDDIEFGMMISEVKNDLNNRDGEMYKAKVLMGKEFKLELTNLSPGTNYYYCAWLFLNDTQYEFGEIKKFTTDKENAGNPDNPNSNYQAKAFSVSATKQVYFSPGNLQYTRSTDTWSFASTQYEIIGTDNVTGGSVYSDRGGEHKSGTALADKVDLFGWSTSTTNFGVSTSTDNDDYSGSFVDWGANKIGDDAPNTWRTLTYDEWNYLRCNRTNAYDLCGIAQVNGVNGIIFLPDNWTCPAGVTFKSGSHSSYGGEYYAAYQTFTADRWSKLEKSGAVFFPAAGSRAGSDVFCVRKEGRYWSTSEYDSYQECHFYFYSLGAHVGGLGGGGGYNRTFGFSVRLVQDLQ